MINMRVVSIAVSVALGMIGAVGTIGPERLGITPVASQWLLVVSVGLGIFQGFLPRVQGPTTDPEKIANRVSALPEYDQRQVVSQVTATASHAAEPDAVAMISEATDSLTEEDKVRLISMMERRRDLLRVSRTPRDYTTGGVVVEPTVRPVERG